MIIDNDSILFILYMYRRNGRYMVNFSLYIPTGKVDLFAINDFFASRNISTLVAISLYTDHDTSYGLFQKAYINHPRVILNKRIAS